jgi:hypothetical protein
MMTRRKLFKLLGIATAALVTKTNVKAIHSEGVAVTSREQQVLDLFQQDPIKAIALARTFFKVDPEWRKTVAFVRLATTPFGDYVRDISDNDWNRSDLYLG